MVPSSDEVIDKGHMPDTSSALTTALHASTSYEDDISAATSDLNDAAMSYICPDGAASGLGRKNYHDASYAKDYLADDVLNITLVQPHITGAGIDGVIPLRHTQPEFLVETKIEGAGIAADA